MSPSHVGYYFDNKAAILEYYASGLCDQVLDGLPDLEEPHVGRLLEKVAHYYLGDGQTSSTLLGVVQELTGLSVHDARLNELKTEHATAVRSYFEALFARTQAITGLPAREAAWRAHAMVVGLDTNTLFDRQLSRKKALAIFHQALRGLAGLDRLARLNP